MVSKKKRKRSSPNLRVIFRPKSKIQTFFSPKIRWSPKKKRSSPNLRLVFRPESLGCGWWGDASRNGAELFEIEADFSAKIVTFRLVGGMHPPIPPPKSATGQGHKRKCSPKIKKKGLHKNFLSDLHKKTFSKEIFKPRTG